ncbi:MAG: RES family NAD+ phosphorylase [Candidatus Omnitrophota bacterium]
MDYIFEILNRSYPIETGTKLYRAQIGCEKDGLSYSPLPKDRMDAPDPEKAKGGRVSCPGIMCLYLATAWQTALAEMRPWKGAYITLVPFVAEEELNLLDLTKDIIGSIGNINDRSIFELISLNFSAPMEDYEEHFKYIFTQYLSSIIKSNGYDGIIYDSYLDSQGKNIALFDSASAQQVVGEGKLYKTKKSNML